MRVYAWSTEAARGVITHHGGCCGEEASAAVCSIISIISPTTEHTQCHSASQYAKPVPRLRILLWFLVLIRCHVQVLLICKLLTTSFKMPQAALTLLDLNGELLSMILASRNLDVEDVLRTSRTCSRLLSVCQEPCIWEGLFARHFPPSTSSRQPATPAGSAGPSTSQAGPIVSRAASASTGQQQAPPQQVQPHKTVQQDWKKVFKERCVHSHAFGITETTIP